MRQGRRIADGGGAVQELANPEIEQLGLAVIRHEDVDRLEVAVDNQWAMRVLDSVADFAEQVQALGDPQALSVAVLGDRYAFDILHDQEGPAGPGLTSVEKAGDVGVLETSQDAALAAQPPGEGGPFHRAPDDFDGDRAPALLSRPIGQVDRAHPTLAQELQHPIGADPLAGQPVVSADPLGLHAIGR